MTNQPCNIAVLRLKVIYKMLNLSKRDIWWKWVVKNRVFRSVGSRETQ